MRISSSVMPKCYSEKTQSHHSVVVIGKHVIIEVAPREGTRSDSDSSTQGRTLKEKDASGRNVPDAIVGFGSKGVNRRLVSNTVLTKVRGAQELVG